MPVVCFDEKIQLQQMQFSGNPGLASSGGLIAGVTIGGLRAVRRVKMFAKNSDFSLVFTARFEIVDIAIAARHWVPLRDPEDIRDGRTGVDQVRRFRAFCDVHGLDAATRARMVDECLAFLDRALVSMKTRADEGQPLYVVAWNEGYAEQNRRSRRWLEAQASALLQS